MRYLAVLPTPGSAPGTVSHRNQSDLRPWPTAAAYLTPLPSPPLPWAATGEGLRRKMGRRTHSVPEYLERRKSVKRTTSAAGSVQQTAGQQRQRRAEQQQQQQQRRLHRQEAAEWADQQSVEHQRVEWDDLEEQPQQLQEEHYQQQQHQEPGRHGQCTVRETAGDSGCFMAFCCHGGAKSQSLLVDLFL